MKTITALIDLARCAVALLECASLHQVTPVEFQFGGGL